MKDGSNISWLGTVLSNVFSGVAERFAEARQQQALSEAATLIQRAEEEINNGVSVNSGSYNSMSVRPDVDDRLASPTGYSDYT